jgi:hypothetical protein
MDFYFTWWMEKLALVTAKSLLHSTHKMAGDALWDKVFCEAIQQIPEPGSPIGWISPNRGRFVLKRSLNVC